MASVVAVQPELYRNTMPWTDAWGDPPKNLDEGRDSDADRVQQADGPRESMP